MVAVVTGWNEGRLMNQPLDMVQHYILPAAIPPSPESGDRQPAATTTKSP
jgi:hypothetical protein